jgi:carboxypeptidase T
VFQQRRSVALAATLACAGALLFGPWSSAADPGPQPTPTGPVFVFRVNAPLGDAAQDLLARGFDVLEQREGDDLFVLGRSDTAQRLTDAGFRPLVSEVLDVPKWTPPARRGQASVLTAADVNETYYGGYHTVNAQYAHLDKVAADYPSLATVVDYGDSWRKSKGSGGYDLKAICVTKKATGDCATRPDATKPRMFVMGQLHAREITTGDVAWRWIDHLVTGYGSNSEVTALLDTTEIWVVPIANPDGVDIVQQGGNSPRYQRKNGNTSNGANCAGTASDQIGVDLNRNTSSGWGTGSTSQPCGETYRGPQADSEVETKALQQLWRNLYRDRRESGPSAAAPPDTTGMAISMHSTSNLVLFPWGKDSSVKTGNDTSLRAMAKDMAALAGGWRYGQPGEVLYNAGGSTDDWIYDDLGVASYVWEIGPSSGACGGFLPAYSCQSGTLWPMAKPMLTYAAKKAANPYGGVGTPTGPTVTAVGNQSNVVGDTVSITAKATGGTTPYSWSASGLPAGLAIASDTGVISGKPTAAGTSNVTLTVKDAGAKTATTSFTWTVTSGTGGGTVTVTKPADQWSFRGWAIQPLQIRATSTAGGTLTFTATGLPPGLSISSTGVITGTPTTSGNYSVTVTAKDAGGGTGTTTFTWQVSGF